MDIGGQVTWAAAVQAAASIVGFLFVGYQVWQLRRNIRGATQDRLYAHYTEICKLLMQKPALRPYFYENKRLDPDDPNRASLRVEIDILSEAILGLIEHATLQKGNLPRHAWEQCWRPYAYERIDKSEEIKLFFNPNQQWYTQALSNVFADYETQKYRPRQRGIWARIRGV